MINKESYSNLSLFGDDKHWIFSNRLCEICSRSNQVLYVLGMFKGESFSCFRFLCCFCRNKLSYILGPIKK